MAAFVMSGLLRCDSLSSWPVDKGRPRNPSLSRLPGKVVETRRTRDQVAEKRQVPVHSTGARLADWRFWYVVDADLYP